MYIKMKVKRLLANVEEMGLDSVIVIGGDGTMNIAHEMAGLGLKVVGVPKTIDNDLSATDQTFGFETAVNTATDAIDKLSHHCGKPSSRYDPGTNGA